MELLVARLREQGYRFHTNDESREDVDPWVPSRAGSADALRDWAKEHLGAVPMTLLAWAQIAGDVWLVGTHPQWPDAWQADPLVLEPSG